MSHAPPPPLVSSDSPTLDAEWTALRRLTPTCLRGHELEIGVVGDSHVYATGWFCDRCRASQGPSVGRWVCSTCQFDLCFTCLPLEPAAVVTTTPSTDRGSPTRTPTPTCAPVPVPADVANAATWYAMDPFASEEVRQGIQAVLATFQVPGLALSVVKDDVEVAYGCGWLQDGVTTRPVNEHSLFAIASNSKLFTAVALGLLVDEGRVTFDTPVSEVLPAFALRDPWISKHVTLRDLLSHRSGLQLGEGDLLWWPPTSYQRQELVQRLRHLSPDPRAFRTQYHYCNLGYVVVAQAIEALAGTTWEEFVQVRIFDRLGCRDAAFANALLDVELPERNVAHSHAYFSGRLRQIKPFVNPTANPLGGIVASAADMTRWLRVLLANGKLPDGSVLFSPQVATELFSLAIPQTPSAFGGLPPPRIKGYGLGLELEIHGRYSCYSHGGLLPGYVSLVSVIPELQLGISVLTNAEWMPACYAVQLLILQHFCPDAVALTQPIIPHCQAVADPSIFDQSFLPATPPVRRHPHSLALSEYACALEDRWYGFVFIRARGSGLEIEFSQTPLFKGTLRHWNRETFYVEWDDRELRADAWLTFKLNHRGVIKGARMKAASGLTDFSFDFHHLKLKRA